MRGDRTQLKFNQIPFLGAALTVSPGEVSAHVASGKLSLGLCYAYADAFRSALQQDHAFFKQLIPKIGLRA